MSAVGRSRVRIAHTKTIKAGWGHETSAEFEWTSDGSGDEVEAAEHLAKLLAVADALGRAESARRTALDAMEAES